MVLRLVLFGAPGSGKGTQAALLKKQFNILHVSTGNIFREYMREKSSLGIKVQSYIDAGNLVPDDIVIELVRVELEDKIKGNGFVFDGFPRTVFQAKKLGEMLDKSGKSLTSVLSLEVNNEELIHRLSGRRMCSTCGAIYHIDNLAGKNVCPTDHTELVQREDDRAEAVKIRLETFKRETLPLKEYYKDCGLLVEIDGSGRPEEIFERILKSLPEN
ncbi:MAG: adenylate kinase [bacterium]|nr:adenylate kinase [bacterium]